jgi:hypothetical protein
MDEKKPPQDVIINSGTVVGSAYAQVSRVTVSDIDITIEFAYIHPADPTQGQTVARITMPIAGAVSLGETIIAVKKMFDKRKEGNQNG